MSLQGVYWVGLVILGSPVNHLAFCELSFGGGEEGGKDMVSFAVDFFSDRGDGNVAFWVEFFF